MPSFKAPTTLPSALPTPTLVDPDILADLKSPDNAANLEVGKTFPNYEALCNALDEPTCTGNAKIAQHRAWASRFSHTRSGHSYTITDITLTSFLPNPNAYSKTRLDWLTPCSLTLLAYLRHCEVLAADRHALYLAHYTANKGTPYAIPAPQPQTPHTPFVCYIPQAFLHKYLGFPDPSTLKAYFSGDLYKEAASFIAALYSGTTESLLKSLQNHCYITWEYSIYYRKSNGTRGRSTSSEYATFISAKRYALDTLGCKNLWSVYKSGKITRFLELQREKTTELLDWVAYTENYAIRYTETTIQAWLKSETKRLAIGKDAKEWVSANTHERLAKWLTDYVEECLRLGVGKGVLGDMLETLDRSWYP